MSNIKNNISFVIPAFNCEATVLESVDSIFKDNFENGDEVIIVNDSSTDSTEDVLSKIKEKYPVVKIIKNAQNKGCPASRNVGIGQAKNPLIFNLDSDNILVPGSIAPLKKFIESENADVAAFGELHYFQKNPKKISHKWIFKTGILTIADFLAGNINPGPSGNFLYTKKSWEKIGKYWEYGKGLHEAWGFSLKQLASGAKFVVMLNSHYLHRIGHDSLFVSQSRKENGSLMATKMIMPFINLLNEEDANYIKSNQEKWYDNLNSHPIRLRNQEPGYTGSVLRDRSFITKVINKLRIRKFYNSIKNRIDFVRDYISFKRGYKTDRGFLFSWKTRRPFLNEKTALTSFDAHYIYHPAWAARVLSKTRPAEHIDISSSLSFSTMVSAFIPVKFYDYRPAKVRLSNLSSGHADLLSLPFTDNSVSSLSCMHTIEHIGLGRYGDKIGPDDDLKAISELKRVLSPSGDLLFVVPIGKPKIMFNAHRIYSYEQIISYFSDLKLQEFSLIPDNAKEVGMIMNATKELSDAQTYGCGCFWFKK
jgi:glycosyltransferase involved in cell wall biosynthesis